MSELLVEDLSIERGRRRVVERVGFSLAPSDILAVLGPNGAGKTSLLDAVLGWLPLASGRVLFGGVALTDLKARSRVFASMPDEAEPPAEVGVDWLVRDAVRRSRVDRARAEALSGRLGLGPLMSARAGELSRGEKRRVLLFEALCLGRPVTVLDEPLGVFDPLQVREVAQVLKENAAAGGALLLSVHQLSDAEKVANRFLFLDSGRVVADGTLEALRARMGRPEARLEDIFLAALEGKAHAPA